MAYEDDPYVSLSFSKNLRVLFDSNQLTVIVDFRYRDEDGEPLMDYDEIQSDCDRSLEPNQYLLDDNLLEADQEKPCCLAPSGKDEEAHAGPSPLHSQDSFRKRCSGPGPNWKWKDCGFCSTNSAPVDGGPFWGVRQN